MQLYNNVHVHMPGRAPVIESDKTTSIWVQEY